MRTQLREEQEAEIVIGDGVAELLVDGEVVASEDCDTTDEASIETAVASLTKRALKLGFEESDDDPEGEFEEGVFDASYSGGGRVLNGDRDDDWTSGESTYARRLRRQTMPVDEMLRLRVSEAVLALPGVVSQIDALRDFDAKVAEGCYEEAFDVAEEIARSLDQLDEYRRLTGSRLSNFRRSRRVQNPQEKLRNRKRRMMYRTNATMRRQAKRYRTRVKRFIRR